VIFLDGQAAGEFVFAPGQEIGGYRIMEVKAAGGMGAIYRALELARHREVAIKTLPFSFTGRRRARFEAEIEVLSGLDHPNIIRIYDKGEAGRAVFYTMEYVPGPTVRELLKNGPLAVEEAVGIARQVLSALSHLHAKGIVHRDVKPSNILMDVSGSAKLTDFGICLVTEAQAAGDEEEGAAGGEQIIMGTPTYMAPEQRTGRAVVDARADLYSLGRSLYEMVTGVVPDTYCEPASRLNPGVPPELDRVLDRALALKPEGRYGSAAEFERDLAALDAVREPEGTGWSLPFKVALYSGVVVLGIVLTVGAWVVYTLNMERPVKPAFTGASQAFYRNVKAARVMESRGNRPAALLYYRMALSYRYDAAIAEEVARLERTGEGPGAPSPAPPTKGETPEDQAAQARAAAREAIASGNREAARAALRRLFELRPDDPEGRALLSRAKREAGRAEAARIAGGIEKRWARKPAGGATEAELLVLVRDLRVLCALGTGRLGEARNLTMRDVSARPDAVAAALEDCERLLSPTRVTPAGATGYWARIRQALEGCAKAAGTRTGVAVPHGAYEAQLVLNETAVQDAAAAAYLFGAVLSRATGETARGLIPEGDERCQSASEQFVLGLQGAAAALARLVRMRFETEEGGP
jgi:tetratricopeptide (TPR) repeat protein